MIQYSQRELEEIVEAERLRIWELVTIMPHARKEELDIIKKKIFD